MAVTAPKQSETRERVLDLIERLGVGEAIPSERQLSADLGVSRLTVRAALDELVREGYLIRRRGSGNVRQRAEDRAGVDDDLLHRGHAPARMEPGEPDARARGRPRGPGWAESCTSRPRSRSSSSSACGSRTTRRWRSRPCTSAQSLVPGLSAERPREQSFYELLSDRYGIDIVGGVQTIEPTVTNEEESEALGVPLHSPAFLFERTTRSRAGEIVEYVRSLYRGDRYRMVTELSAADARR